MELFTPDIGLIFWQAVVFLVLLFFLMRFAWGPITRSLREREDYIEGSLRRAEEARALLEEIKAERRSILQKAQEEREASLEQTRVRVARMQEEAQERAKRIGEEMILSAEASIKREKEAAMRAVRDQVVDLSIQVAEKVLKDRLAGQGEQKKLLARYLSSIHGN